MKKRLLTLMAVLALLGCKDNPVTKKIKETRNTVSNTTNAVKEMNRMQEDLKDLSEIEPLTNKEFKTWLPDEINGMKRISFKAGETGLMGVASISATYTNEDKSKQFSISVIDGAGEMGAGMTAGMRIILTQDMEEEDEYSTRRSLTRKGQKAIEEFKKDNSSSTIQLMSNNRFYLEANGKNMDPDEMWEAIDELDMEDLG
ncbi:hypothetical protein EI546_11175 [Aequorivita sp. H23M31]|uniref:Uncharacterized protein n=1 Tax=Aequorivita ciconiae TaxID=2494375 RepID=A0A410G4R9_9FLAO|nr:hypothetical protein [Aequorivita sp. H23M31]QAA82246.1 hypothetical protein EI546_11175 [Aequorivita sp. H23M31]